MWHQLPNAITLLRCLLIIPFAFALYWHDHRMAFVIFTIAGVSDGVDGFLAKRFGWQSQFGARLDPIADKLLLVTGFGMLTWLAFLPWWLFALVLLRDVVIVSGAITYHRIFGPYPMQPTMISKINTVLQITVVGEQLFSLAVYTLPDWLAWWLIVATVITTVWSGADYVYTWSQRYYHQLQQRKELKR
jgi:cardiolipin synthase